MSDRLPVVADIPTATPGLGFPEYIEALADAVRGGEPPQFTVGLYGAWGSGKSSLLKGIHGQLAQDPSVIPVLFDAWRYERGDHIVVPLLHTIATAVERAGHTGVAQHLRRALGALVYGLSFSVGGLRLSGSDLHDGWEQEELPKLDEAFARPFEELRKIPEALEGSRIAVLIDDLDRCSPGKIVTVMEAINLVTDIPGFVFVLAIDYDVLTAAVTQQYPHVSGHRFVEKIIQLPFRVPPLAIDGDGFLEQLIPEPASSWRSVVPPEFAAAVSEIATLALRSNPRQIKRLINSFILVDRIVQRRGLETDAELMGATIGLQLGWPDAYELLQDAVLAGEQTPQLVLTSGVEDDENLRAYAARFFGRDGVGAEQLRQLVVLTAVVSSDQSVVEEQRLSAVREDRLAEFVLALRQRGFEPSGRSERIFYNADLPDVRFVLSDSRFVVRFEKRRSDGTWRLWESYLVTRETDEALKVIDEPDRHFTNRR